MADDRTDAVRALLEEAERAHGAYEATELGGVYDAGWADWYAAHLVDHGLGRVVGREVTSSEVSDALAAGFAEYDASDPKPTATWAEYLARRLLDG